MTGLRGLAALAVATYHAGDMSGRQVLPHGYLAVDVFFVLSGFVLALTAGPALRAGGWAGLPGFLWRRAARILPLNTAVVCGIAAANWAAHGGAGAGRIGCNILMLQGWTACTTLNAPAWTLSFEWLAYACFPLLLGAFAGRAWAVACALAAAALMILSLASGHGSLDSAQMGPGWSALRCLAGTGLGVACWHVWSGGKAGMPAAALAGAAALLFGLGAGDLWAVPGSMAAILLAAQARGAARLLGWAPLHWLGLVSFSLYLLHDPVMQREARLFSAIAGASWRTQSPLAACFTWAAPLSVLPAALLFFVAVETPGRRLLQHAQRRGSMVAQVRTETTR